MRYLLSALLAVTIIGCGSPPSESDTTYYYNLDSLINSQQQALLTTEAKLHKLGRIGNDSSVNVIAPDSLTWVDELGVFREIDINQPVLQGLYQVANRNDDKSNLKIREFIAAEGEDLKVTYLRLYYLNDLSQVRKLEAEYHEDNPIYNSGRVLEMEFEDIKGTPMLSAYAITGSQKMMLQDLTTFSIQAEVKY